jgi:Ca-activated chloride channel family protein
MAVSAPIDRAHGADPKQPQTILPIPPPEVLEKIASTWQLTKRGADVAVVFDKSASMKGWPLTEAKAGAEAFVDALGDRDEVAFAPFDDVVYPARGPFRVGDAGIRSRMKAEIELTKAGGRTSLYDAIAAAYDQALVRAAKAPGSIHAVVVMTDGKDEGSRTTLYLLKKRLARDAPVKLFTIAYGEGAESAVLRDIAEAAGGWSGKGSTETIRDIYVEVAAFF